MNNHPIAIDRLDHVVIRVRDIDSMTRWYVDVLGCTVEREVEDAGLVQLRAGSSLIDLVTANAGIGLRFEQAPDPTAPNLDHFCISLAQWDPDSIRDHLESTGVKVGDVERRYGAQGFGPSLYIDDPEGNTVELKGPPDTA